MEEGLPIIKKSINFYRTDLTEVKNIKGSWKREKWGVKKEANVR
jgi:hypothetical protein